MQADLLLLCTFVLAAVGDAKHNWPINYEWGNLERVEINGYSGAAMDPFLSRDGKWLFWGTFNKGVNISLLYAKVVNTTFVDYMGPMKGSANGPIPHLDAVPSMDNQNRFYWVSTRGWPENYDNLETGIFHNGTIPTANHVRGNIYTKVPSQNWIVNDQEINEDGSLLFYVDSHIPTPPSRSAKLANISMATRQSDGTFLKHPHSARILHTVNNLIPNSTLVYAPSSLGTNALELYFTVVIPKDPRGTALFVAKRKSSTEPFGQPEEIRIPSDGKIYVIPEAPTLTPDGKTMLFKRNDCVPTCVHRRVYKMDRK